MEESLASQIDILVDGTAVDVDLMSHVISVSVEQSTHLPGMFTIHISDDHDHTLIDGSTFGLTKEVEIKGYTASGTATSLIKGEIVSVEPLLQQGMRSELLVQGYHKSHRLFRETKTVAYLNTKDSDLASDIASNASLSADVDSTSTVYDHLFQHNQTDMAFLTQRAWRIGYECFVDDGKLHFRKPVNTGSGIALKWGEDLISFRARASLADQVGEVQVKGWDPEKLEAIVGKSTKGTLYPSATAGDDYSKNSSFGKGLQVFVDMPVATQAEANLLAEARINEASGVFIIVEGEAYQRPDVIAGKLVDIDGVGAKYAGNYMVTETRHSYDMENGLRVSFKARGLRNGLLVDQMMQLEPLDRWPGVVMALVTDTDDPDDWGRVKVKYPWMANDAESWWARLLAPGAGPDAGFIAIPEVGDEVVIAFEHGDFNRPVIIGGLWNGKHKLPPPVAGAGSGEKPQVRSWHSIKGHHISVYDNDDDKIEIVTVGGHTTTFDDANKMIEIKTSGGHSITMDDQGKVVEVKTSGGHKITMDDNGRKIIIESSGDLEIKAGMNMKLEASANMDIKASGPINIKGAVINLN